MKKTFLFLSIILILILFLIYIYQSPIPIKSQKDIESLENNQLVSFTGKVIDEKYTKTGKIINFKNNFSIFCTSCPDLLNKSILVTAKVEDYYDKKQLTLKDYSFTKVPSS